MESVSDINIQLMLGKLPDCLNFAPRQRDEIDLEKLSYNVFYKSPEFQLSRISNPIAFLNMPAGKEIIEAMAENARSPLEEILDRQEHLGIIEVLDE